MNTKLPNIIDKHQRTVWLRAFRIWQHRPHVVAPLSEVVHECASCHTKYQGNYCPRCGQSATVGRFSFKKALLLFLDVWGVGNRGMFRSIRDLMLRPGYMIRDYLSGMQSAYFPPFKMFFLLTALSLLVQHGFNLGLEDARQKEEQAAMSETPRQNNGININTDNAEDPEMAEQVKETLHTISTFGHTMNSLREKNPAIFALLSLVLFSLPLYYFIRHTPTIPDFRFSEFIVALIYTANMFSIFSIAGSLLNSGLLKLLAILMIFVTFHQLTGYSKPRIFGYVVLTTIISVASLILIASAGGFIAYLLT